MRSRFAQNTLYPYTEISNNEILIKTRRKEKREKQEERREGEGREGKREQRKEERGGEKEREQRREGKLREGRGGKGRREGRERKLSLLCSSIHGSEVTEFTCVLWMVSWIFVLLFCLSKNI